MPRMRRHGWEYIHRHHTLSHSHIHSHLGPIKQSQSYRKKSHGRPTVLNNKMEKQKAHILPAGGGGVGALISSAGGASAAGAVIK